MTDKSYIPPKNVYLVTWYNPEMEAIEKDVVVQAHLCEVSERGGLIFRSFMHNDEFGIAKGEPPIVGYYERTFQDHISMKQLPSTSSASMGH